MLHKLPNGTHIDLSEAVRIQPFLKSTDPKTWKVTRPHVCISFKGGTYHMIENLRTNKAAQELADELAQAANISNL